MDVVTRPRDRRNWYKIIPIVLTGGGPPPILADKKYVDLTKNWAAGISELLRAVL
jgi:hypothetical protein